MCDRLSYGSTPFTNNCVDRHFAVDQPLLGVTVWIAVVSGSTPRILDCVDRCDLLEQPRDAVLLLSQPIPQLPMYNLCLRVTDVRSNVQVFHSFFEKQLFSISIPWEHTTRSVSRQSRSISRIPTTSNPKRSLFRYATY